MQEPALALLLLLPLAATLLPLETLRFGKRSAGRAAALVPAVQVALLLALRGGVEGAEALRFSVPWLSGAGLNFSLLLDGLSWMFAFLISGVGVAVFFYSASYLEEEPHRARFFRYLLLFDAAMMGVVLADNLIVLVVAWELTSVSSFLLIGFQSRRQAACDGAIQSLLVTAAGGLVMFLGILLLYGATGTLEISQLEGRALPAGPLMPLIAVLILLGALTKSAQFPFHFWLPSAMEAPTPVSAYLHAATMVKAGIYLVARLSPVFSTVFPWCPLTTGIGALTMLWGGYLACKQTDLKALLAYSTVSQLGLIMFLLGLDTDVSRLAALLHTVNHAAFKGALFLIAGAVENAAGTRDLRKLGGLAAGMPVTAALATLAALSMAGLPPLGGFISKELFYDAALDAPGGRLLVGVALAGGCLTFFYSFLFVHGTFFSRARSEHAHAHETPRGMLWPLGTLAAAALAFGVAPVLPEGLIEAATVTLGVLPGHLALWHGFTPALGLSVATVCVGAAACAGRSTVLEAMARLPAPYSAGEAYAWATDALNRLAVRLRSLHMTGLLTHYVLYMFFALLAGSGVTLALFFGPRVRGATLGLDLAPVEHHEWGLALLMALGAVGCCRFRARVPLILSLGVVGALVSLFFVLLRAPDLALTQLLVESVSLILFLLVFRYLSRIKKQAFSVARGARDWLVSLGVGATVVGLLVAANAGSLFPSAVTPYYLAHSHELAGGRNVVNVIVVDFRGYDTMGEITVFAVAALAVFAMVRMGQRPKRANPADAPASVFPSPILRSIARLSLHLMLLFSMYLLFRGHNSPGGGFIAGVLTAVAVILQMVAFDIESFRQEIPWNPLVLVTAGLALSAFTGLGALAFGRPFLTSTFAHTVLPLLGYVELATAALFDVGVYLVVVGTALGVIRTIAEG